MRDITRIQDWLFVRLYAAISYWCMHAFLTSGWVECRRSLNPSWRHISFQMHALEKIALRDCRPGPGLLIEILQSRNSTWPDAATMPRQCLTRRWERHFGTSSGEQGSLYADGAVENQGPGQASEASCGFFLLYGSILNLDMQTIILFPAGQCGTQQCGTHPAGWCGANTVLASNQ